MPNTANIGSDWLWCPGHINYDYPNIFLIELQNSAAQTQIVPTITVKNSSWLCQAIKNNFDELKNV